jgi:hypothetical protein
MWKQRASSRRAIATVAMFLPPAPSQLAVGAGEHGVALGGLGGLLQDPAHPGEPCLVMWPWRTVRSELRTWGVNPAQAHSLRAVGNPEFRT